MNWDMFIQQQQQQDYFLKLNDFLKTEEAMGKTIFPKKELRFNAFQLTPLEKIKVVILGQDPYHGAGQAHGLSFSVLEDIKIPPSLRNIYKELSATVNGYQAPATGNLSHWAKQGVFLLNAVLTVEQANAGSHAKQGWEIFTDNVIKQISEQRTGIIFVLWGSYAHKKSMLIDQQKHTILKSAHPSPLSAYRGFFGCDHFNQVNRILRAQNLEKIIW
jgi:uracil-DNA glycosylase